LILGLFIGKSKIKLIIYLAFIHNLSYIPIFKQKNKVFPPIVPIQKISRAERPKILTDFWRFFGKN